MNADDPKPTGFDKSSPDLNQFRRTFESKYGETFNLRPSDIEDFERLLYMFDSFEPKEAAQGLPSCNEESRKTWVRKMLLESIIVVSDINGEIAGHACLIDIEPGIRAELEIMVHQTWRNRGFGSAMLELILEIARHLGYKRVWLVVDAKNSIAVDVYRKHGFKLVGPFDLELELELEL